MSELLPEPATPVTTTRTPVGTSTSTSRRLFWRAPRISRAPSGCRTDGFSQGERMKTALARALVHDPANIILDEPTNGLDVMATRALRHFLLALRAEGRCIVLSSHVMQEVAALCDHIVVIAAGRVVASGSADALRQQTGEANLEDAFVKAIGSEEGLHA